MVVELRCGLGRQRDIIVEAVGGEVLIQDGTRGAGKRIRHTTRCDPWLKINNNYHEHNNNEILRITIMKLLV